MTGNPDHMADITCAHAKHGVTSLVLVTSSDAIEKIEVSLEAIAHIAGNIVLDGSNMLESYAEGKFSCMEKGGTQNPIQ